MKTQAPMKWMFIVFLSLMVPVGLLAQQGTITGTVVDATSGEPLPAANVIIEGTNMGASANAEGQYTIRNVPPGNYTVTASFIGYKRASQSVSVAAGATVTVNFRLDMSILDMDELIVTATGIRRKVEIGNSIARIDVVDDVKERPIFDITDLLQGQASGVQVFESGGSIGMGARIRVRGSNSASLSNEPVIYLDGVLINNQPNSISYETGGQSPSRLNDINPEDIESIEIIKGPSAATLYGSIAANGVIRITTKRGKTGRPRWSAFLETGIVYDVGKYPANYQALDANGQPCFTFQAAEGLCTQATVKFFQPLTDPRTSPFRTGLTSGSGLSVSGGTQRLTYFLSGYFSNKEGVLPINNLRQSNFRGNFGAQVTNTLRVNLSTSYLKSNLQLPLNDNYALGLMGQGLNGRASPDINDGWGEFTPDELFTIDSRQIIDRFTSGLEINWDPMRNLSFRVAGGLDFTSRWDNQFFPTGKAPAFLNYDKGARFSNRFNEFVYTLDIVGSYTHKLSESFTSRTSAGFQYLQNLIQGTMSTGLQLVAGSSSIAGAAITFSQEMTTEQRTVGLFIEEQLVYRDRLFLTGALRADRGSAFGAALEAVIYPKVSVSWLISDEAFFKTDWITSLRLRGAWGESGVQPGTNDALRYFAPIAATVDGQNVTGVTFGGVGNADLKPERSQEIEVGVDATLFSDRVGVELTYFNKQTRDALIFRELPPSLGVGPGRFENLGSVQNTGFEITLFTRVFDNGTTSLNLDFVGSFVDNKLKKLGEGIQPVVFGLQRHVEGYPLGGYWDETYTYSDKNGDGLIGRDEVEVGETTYLGTPFPTTDIAINGKLGLFGNRIVVKGLLNFRGGHKLYNNTGAWRNGNSNTRELNDPKASLADQARAIASKFYGTNAGYIEDASFWRLREVSITYNVPKTWARMFGVNNLSLTVAGQNLALWTKYTGLDPEINSTGQSNFVVQEFLSQPPVRSWKARINISF